MKAKNMLQGAVLGALLLFLMSMYIENIDREVQRGLWKKDYEQTCVEDGNSPKDCLCAVAFIEQSTTAAELTGDVIYIATKENLQGVCLE